MHQNQKEAPACYNYRKVNTATKTQHSTPLPSNRVLSIYPFKISSAYYGKIISVENGSLFKRMVCVKWYHKFLIQFNLCLFILLKGRDLHWSNVAHQQGLHFFG